MAYHYLNAIDDYNDNITTLADKFNIHPKVIYDIGYTKNNISNNNIHEYFLNENILSNKILEQQTIETPDLININNNIHDMYIFHCLTNSDIILKETKYIIIKMDIDCDYVNQLGFIDF